MARVQQQNQQEKKLENIEIKSNWKPKQEQEEQQQRTKQ